uniref:Bm10420, isoform d n=1 Tax=Brugia malayi TaxID=6279 RepID=A0A1I9G3L4_BRUMA|nr:Bm10420, isoform d [Brugia malayi]
MTETNITCKKEIPKYVRRQAEATETNEPQKTDPLEITNRKERVAMSAVYQSEIRGNAFKSLEITEQKVSAKDVTVTDIRKLTIDEKVIPKESLGRSEQKVTLDNNVVGDISEASGKEKCIQKEKLLITADQDVISSDGCGSFSNKKLDTAETTSCINSKANVTGVLLDPSNCGSAKKPGSSEVLVEVSIVLISGELKVRIRPKQIAERILKMNSESETDSSVSEIDFVVLNKEDQEKRKIESSEGNKERWEVTLNPEQSQGGKVLMEPKIKGRNEQLLRDAYQSSDDVITAIQTMNKPGRTVSSSISNLEALYENVVRAVLLYARINGFLLLRCIIDNPTFNTTIYEKDDVIREVRFLKSVYNEARNSTYLQRQRGRREFISCSFLFDIVKFIKRNEVYNLLEKGVVKTIESYNFFDLNLFLVTPNDVEKLYETDLAIITHFDLLIDHRFFTSSLRTAQRTMETKPLVVKYANIRIQLSFFKLLIQHIKALNMENLDKLTDLKLFSEEDRKDPCCYNILQAQEMIRNEHNIWKGADKAFRLLPTVTEYLVGRRQPKNNTSLNLYCFIMEFLMVVPYREFIHRRYDSFIAHLCMDQESCSSILNPATVINRILIPNLKRPIRKICAAITIGRLLDSRHVNISWSFDYTEYKHCYNDDNITTQTGEKVELIQLIGAFYLQYTFPHRNAVRGSRYFYIDLVLSRLESRLTRLITKNCFTENALKYLDELVVKKEFPWQADYYLSKILLRKLLASREVSIPERPVDETDERARIEWVAKLLPITYAGIKPKPFFSLAFLIDGQVNEEAVLDAKHRVLQWAEAYVANSKVLGTDDAKAMLCLLRWKDEPGLKVMEKWIPCGKSIEEIEEYLNHLPPSRASEVKVYKPTRLLQYKRVRHDEQTPWERCQMNKFLNETADYHCCGGASRMRNRPTSGPGMFGYARPMYVWSIGGVKLMPFSALKNKYEDVPSDVSKLNRKKRLPFDLRAEVGSIWQDTPSALHNSHSRPRKRNTSSQSVNLPVSRDRNNEIFRMEIPYDPFVVMPIDAFDLELDFGASAANFKGTIDMRRSYSLPCDLSNLNLRTKKIVPRRLARKEKSKQWQQRTKKRTANLKENVPIRRSDSASSFNGYIINVENHPDLFFFFLAVGKYVKKERTVFHPFLENIGSCTICGLTDHTEDFCPDTPNYSNLVKRLLPVTYKWTIKKEKAFENFHRQDSWGSFGDEYH